MAGAVFWKNPRRLFSGPSAIEGHPPSFGDGTVFHCKHHDIRIHGAEAKRTSVVVGSLVPFAFEEMRTSLKIGDAALGTVMEGRDRVNGLETHVLRVRLTAEIPLQAPARAQRGRAIVSCNFLFGGRRCATLTGCQEAVGRRRGRPEPRIQLLIFYRRCRPRVAIARGTVRTSGLSPARQAPRACAMNVGRSADKSAGSTAAPRTPAGLPSLWLARWWHRSGSDVREILLSMSR